MWKHSLRFSLPCHKKVTRAAKFLNRWQKTSAAISQTLPKCTNTLTSCQAPRKSHLISHRDLLWLTAAPPKVYLQSIKATYMNLCHRACVSSVFELTFLWWLFHDYKFRNNLFVASNVLSLLVLAPPQTGGWHFLPVYLFIFFSYCIRKGHFEQY